MRSRWFLVGVLACILLLGSVACGSSDQEMASTTVAESTTVAPGAYVTLDVATAHERLSVEEDAQFVDVREPSEWVATGVPPAAILIPLGDIERRAPAELAKD